jgi:hypothetical protein
MTYLVLKLTGAVIFPFARQQLSPLFAASRQPFPLSRPQDPGGLSAAIGQPFINHTPMSFLDLSGFKNLIGLKKSRL